MRLTTLRAKALGSLVMDVERGDIQKAEQSDLHMRKESTKYSQNDTHICDQQSDGMEYHRPKGLKSQQPEKLHCKPKSMTFQQQYDRMMFDGFKHV